MKRSAGILMPISSLPSPYGIGTLGKAAYRFADFLKKAGQTVWQVLPVGQTGFGDSPYQSFSSFAGNPYFIDLEMLVADGLLTKKECDAADFGSDPCRADYGRLYQARYPLLEKAFSRADLDAPDYQSFLRDNAGWLPDYALFMALKEHFDGKPWTDWDEDARMRKPEALAAYRETLKARVSFYQFLQYLFYTQWASFKKYVNSRGVSLIGDVPIYVSGDSVDVWANPDEFELDEARRPINIAGVPPDYFSEDGQRWGNPLYRWDRMKANGYRFWIERIGAASRLFDCIRIDHFRGFASYWSIPASEETAKNGKWVKGPGMDFIGAITSWFSGFPIIAEDLGVLTEDVRDLLRTSGLPGMKVLQFAFDAPDSEYLPHRYERNCVCYLGTHDNDTTRGWLAAAPQGTRARAKAYFGLNRSEGFLWGMIRGGMASPADLFIAQMQDYLNLGSDCRMNAPGAAQGNWGWRMRPDAITPELARKIRQMTKRYGR